MRRSCDGVDVFANHRGPSGAIAGVPLIAVGNDQSWDRHISVMSRSVNGMNYT